MPLLYDGDCRFCTASVAWIRRRFDPEGETVAVRSGELDAVEWVDGDVRASGADAIAAWLRSARRLRAIARLIPIGLPLGRLLYPVVARNRSRLSRLLR